MRARLEFDEDDGSNFTSVEFVQEVHDIAHVSLMIETKLTPALSVDFGRLLAFMMCEEIEIGSTDRVLVQMSTESIEGWIFNLQKELQDRKS